MYTVGGLNEQMTTNTTCDFFLFPRMKGQMKGKPFADVSEVKKENAGVLEQHQQ